MPGVAPLRPALLWRSPYLRPLTLRNLCSTGKGSVKVMPERSFCLKNCLRLRQAAIFLYPFAFDTSVYNSIK